MVSQTTTELKRWVIEQLERQREIYSPNRKRKQPPTTEPPKKHAKYLPSTAELFLTLHQNTNNIDPCIKNIPTEVILCIMAFLPVFPDWLKYMRLNRDFYEIINNMLFGDTPIPEDMQPKQLNLLHIENAGNQYKQLLYVIKKLSPSVKSVILRSNQFVGKHTYDKETNTWTTHEPYISKKVMKILGPQIEHLVVLCFGQHGRPVVHKADELMMCNLKHIEIVGTKHPTHYKTNFELENILPLRHTFTLHGDMDWLFKFTNDNEWIHDNVYWIYHQPLLAPSQNKKSIERSWTPETLSYLKHHYHVTLFTPIFGQCEFSAPQSNFCFLDVLLDKGLENMIDLMNHSLRYGDKTLFSKVIKKMDPERTLNLMKRGLHDLVGEIITNSINFFQNWTSSDFEKCLSKVVENPEMLELFVKQFVPHWKYNLRSIRCLRKVDESLYESLVSRIIDFKDPNLDRLIGHCRDRIEYIMKKVKQDKWIRMTELLGFLLGDGKHKRPEMKATELLNWIKSHEDKFDDPLDMQFCNQNNLLHRCISGDRVMVAHYLIKLAERKKLDVKSWLLQTNENGKTVLDLAEEKKRTKFVKEMNKKYIV
jgi:hypothetical protein